MQLAKRDSGSYFGAGGEIGCLIFHSLAGSPGQVRMLAEFLNEQGFTVLVPSCPWSEDGIEAWLDEKKKVMIAGRDGGQDRDAADRAGSGGQAGSNDDQASDGEGNRAPAETEAGCRQPWAGGEAGTIAECWLRFAEKEVTQMASGCRKIFLIGQSLGAVAALAAGAMSPAAGIVTIGCPIDWQKPRWRQQTFKWFREVWPRIYGQAPEEMPVSVLLDAAAAMMAAARDRIGRIRQPVLLIHSQRDEMIPPAHALALDRLLGSRERKLLWLERSPHIATLGMERNQLFREISVWLKERTAPGNRIQVLK